MSLDISEDLIPSRPIKVAGTSTLSFSGLLSPPLQLHEDVKDGCGGQLWLAGMVLARYLLERTEGLQGKVIVELGAGGGLVGLALALALKQQPCPPNITPSTTPPILITDLPILLPLQAKNISLNALPATSILSAALPWGSPLPPTVPALYRHPDIILAADCVYYEPAFPLLIETLEEFFGEPLLDRNGEDMAQLESKDPCCYFCMKKRRKADMRFIASLKRAFSVVELEKGVVDGEKGVFLYEVRRKMKKQGSGRTGMDCWSTHCGK